MATRRRTKPAPATVGEALERAAAALGAGEDAAALGALLEAWRARPATALAEVIEQVSARVEKGLPPLTGRTAGQLHATWLSTAAAGADADVARLLATLTETRNSKLALVRVEALAGRGRDPRFTGPLFRLLEAPPYLGYDTTTKAFWDGLHALLVAHGDPRVPSLLRALAARYGEVLARAREQMARWMARRALETAAAIEGALPDGLPSLTPAEADLARSLITRARAGRRSGEELLGDVLARPDDDAARMVYGDWLLEQADPRGEFIALQFQRHAGTLSPDGERREQELLETHATSWLGALAPLAEKQGLIFERGFVARIELKLANEHLVQKLAGHPAWATVRELGVGRGDLPVDLVRHPVMRSLRGLDDLSRENLDEVCRLQLPLEYVGFGGYLGQRDQYGVVPAELAAHLWSLPMPSLRGLGLCGVSLWASSFDWLWDSMVGRQLAHFRVEADVNQLASWLQAIDARKIALETLTVRQAADFTGWTCLLRRDGAGRFTRLEVSVGPKPRFSTSSVDKLAAELDKLPPDGLTSFTLHHTPWLPGPKLLRPLAVALERFAIKLPTS